MDVITTNMKRNETMMCYKNNMKKKNISIFISRNDLRMKNHHWNSSSSYLYKLSLRHWLIDLIRKKIFINLTKILLTLYAIQISRQYDDSCHLFTHSIVRDPIIQRTFKPRLKHVFRQCWLHRLKKEKKYLRYFVS